SLPELRTWWKRMWCDDTIRERAAVFGGIVLLWAAYVAAVQAVACAAARDMPAGSLPSRGHYLLHGFVDDLTSAPALARWDSIWFYGIAREGYTGAGPDSRHTPAFLPLYPLAMRLSGDLIGADYFRGGVWVSRLALLAALCLLAVYVRETQPRATPVWPVLAALLAFPSAFILAAVYSESLFLALTLAAFVLAHRRRHALAAGFVLLASLTRIQGLALIPGFAVLAVGDWRDGRRSVFSFAPAAAGAMAYAAMAAACWAAFGDPFYHFAVKRELWHQGFTSPLLTLDQAITTSSTALDQGGSGSLYTILQLPCVYLAIFAGVVLAFEPGRRPWPELTFLAGCLAMSLFGGALDGMPRFMLVLFPVFVALGRLHARPAL
ncbi:MAG: mannosyltransferase family protein, partial [Candidatus Saccharimonadales bacterium]